MTDPRMSHIHISVTQQMLDDAPPHDTGEAMVKRAVTQRHSEPHSVVITRDKIILTNVHPTPSRAYKMPPELADFISRYDRGEPVQPFQTEATRSEA